MNIEVCVETEQAKVMQIGLPVLIDGRQIGKVDSIEIKEGGLYATVVLEISDPQFEEQWTKMTEKMADDDCKSIHIRDSLG